MIPVFVVIAANALAVLPYTWIAFSQPDPLPPSAIEPGGAHASKEELASDLSLLAVTQDVAAGCLFLLCPFAAAGRRKPHVLGFVAATGLLFMVLTEVTGWYRGWAHDPVLSFRALGIIRYGLGAVGPLLLVAVIRSILRRDKGAGTWWIIGLAFVALDYGLSATRAGMWGEVCEAAGAMSLLVAATLLLLSHVREAARELAEPPT